MPVIPAVGAAVGAWCVQPKRFRGTSYRQNRTKWQAQATAQGYSKKVSLGEYADPVVAAAAFNAGRQMLVARGYKVKMMPNEGVPELSGADLTRVHGLVERWVSSAPAYKDS